MTTTPDNKPSSLDLVHRIRELTPAVAGRVMRGRHKVVLYALASFRNKDGSISASSPQLVKATGEPPPEIAGLRPPQTASHGGRHAVAEAVAAEEAALQSLAIRMCTVGGLPVPRAVCQQP